MEGFQTPRGGLWRKEVQKYELSCLPLIYAWAWGGCDDVKTT